MSWLHGAVVRLKLLVQRRTFESRVASEIQFHIEMETERLAREFSLEKAEARRRALVAFGGIEKHREALREGRGLAWLGGLSLDFKLGMRMLAKRPALTVVSVLAMSIAVVVGVLGFAAARAVMTSSLPVSEGDRVVAIENIDLRSNDVADRTHLHDLTVWRAALPAVEALGAFRTADRNFVPTDAAPTSVHLAEMTASAFRIARVTPILGRYFNDADERTGAPAVAVIGYELWQHRLGARPGVIGSTVHLGSAPYIVIGVMPQGFAFPVNERLWIPLQLNPLAFENGEAPPVRIVGRLAPGATLTDARRQLAAISQRLTTDYPKTHEYVRADIMPYTQSFMRGHLWPSILGLAQLVVVLLLAVVATNVAVLVYARTAGRSGELAVRTALGASRSRIVSQLFVESLVLAAVAAGLGLFAAYFVSQRVEAMIAESLDYGLPYWMHLSITPVVVLYVAGLTIVAATIIGFLPGLKATRHHVSENLKEFFGGASMQLGRTWTALLTVQVAVSVAALPAALSMARMWASVTLMDRGTAAASFVIATPLLDVETAPTSTAEGRIAQHDRYVNRVTELAQKLQSEPGGFDVVLMSSTPGIEPYADIDIEKSETMRDADTTAIRVSGSVAINHVNAEFFRAFGVHLQAGRRFSAADFTPGATAVIVNRSFVARFFGGGNAIGRRLRQATTRTATAMKSDSGNEPWWEIVGVVDDYPISGTRGANWIVYSPLRPTDVSEMTLAVRAAALTTSRTTDCVRNLARAVDPAMRFAAIRTLDEVLNSAEEGERLAMLGLLAISASVVLLSAAGIYALMAFTVTRRRREIAIRTALGARSARVIAEILSRAMRQIGIGILLGVAGTAVLSPWLSASARWPETLLLLVEVAAAMAAVGVVATIGPARRALRVQPTEALKAE